jgi:CDP-paratose 2-epimerase
MATTSKKKVLVTGGLGFIGSHVVKRLHGKYDIVVLDWDMSPAAYETADEWRKVGVRIHQKDIADAETWKEIEPCDFVFHAAAQIAAEESWDDPARDFLSNAYGTLLVAEYARKKSACVIYCNSIRIYDPEAVDRTKEKLGVVSEDCNTVDLSSEVPPFAYSKLIGEQYLRHYSRKHGVRVISHRMSGILGPDQKSSQIHGWVSYLVQCAVDKISYEIFGDGDQTRDVLHINDYVDLIEMELKDFNHFVEGNFAVYNIGGGPNNELSINQIIEILDKNHGLKLKYDKTGVRPGEPRQYVSGLNRIYKKGWKPKRNDPIQIIAELVKSYEKGKENATKT